MQLALCDGGGGGIFPKAVALILNGYIVICAVVVVVVVVYIHTYIPTRNDNVSQLLASPFGSTIRASIFKGNSMRGMERTW